MATYLKPDSTFQFYVGNDVLTVNVKITPDGATAHKDIAPHVLKGDYVKPNRLLGDGTGIPRGITVHNTDFIKTASDTNPAEQYARATYPNGNMNGACVHYWVYKDVIWQQLNDNECGWHAGDSSNRKTSQRMGETIGGNLDTISIESIESENDALTEKTTAQLVAYLLYKHNLSPNTDIYTHKFFSGKNCPKYILPKWDKFKATCAEYYDKIANPVLYRVQVGAYRDKASAEKKLKDLEKAGFNGFIVTSDENAPVETPAEKPAESPKPPKTLDEVAKEVINGNYGNGHTKRKANLEKAGLLQWYDYEDIRARVNEMLK